MTHGFGSSGDTDCLPTTSATPNCKSKDNLSGADESNTVSAATSQVLDVRSNYIQSFQIKRDGFSCLLV